MKQPSRKQKHQENSNIKSWREIWHGLRLRQKMVFYAFLTAGIIGAAIWAWPKSDTSDKTQMTLTVAAPTPATFTDDNDVIISTDSIPSVNNNRELNRPTPLVVSYDWTSGPYQGAFKMNLTDAEVAKNIKITPFIKGEWHIRGDATMVFTPDAAWPAATKFTVKINRDMLNPDIMPSATHISFTTPDITAQIASFNIYADSTHPKTMVGVAVISFNYPIDTRNFNDKISLKLDDKKLDFTVKFDRFRRTAFITSSPIEITNAPQIMRLKLNRVPAMDGDAKTSRITANATIESADNFLKVSEITTSIATDASDETQQLILMNTTAAIAKTSNIAAHISAYLLPRHAASEESDAPSHRWQNDEVNADVLKQSEKLTLKPIDFENPVGTYQYAFAYDVSDRTPRYIYISVKSGMESASGFTMKNGIDTVLQVPYPAAEVKIAGSGALLSMAGDKQLGIMARGGVTDAYVNLYKVKSSEINHLISQTYNVFATNMEFKSWSFGAYDMSVVFQKHLSFANASMKHPSYASVDLGAYLDRTQNDKTGIFIVQTGATKNAAEYNDKRLILLTDLGIIRKVASDETSVLFISNLSDGAPAADTEISVLGRNGNAIWVGRTDATGRADIPRFAWNEYRNEKEPVAIVARRGNDVSFIPFNNAYAQRVEYSKFDIEGVYASATTPLNAFLFSDRGIYRPGETAIIGAIVKNKRFTSPSGIPVKLIVNNARGRTVLEKTISLTPSGMFDIEYEIPESAATGEYSMLLYSVNSKNNPSDLLGNAFFRVEEFTPDTMKITAGINGASDNGWISPDNMTANVSLRNMFGTPATNRRIAASATLRPITFDFSEFSNYIFTSNSISGGGLSDNTAARVQTIQTELADVRTNENGDAVLNIKFDREIPAGTYNISLNVRGFESGDGRSVQTTTTTRVSAAKYLVGYNANSDLSYVNRGDARMVNLIAVDHTATRTTASDLTMKLVRRENLTSLIKDYDGYYKYQTITRDKVIEQTQISIPANGTNIKLNTTRGGTYYLQILDASEKILANIEYFVASDENAALETDTNAELQIKLNAAEYAPGDKIQVNITAPYTGTGLITIERDRVYAYKWFRTDKTSSTQSITIPDGFEGTGYINVSYVRSIDSRDIFTTPYTFAVAPFTSDISPRKIKVKLNAPDIVRDNKLTIKYETDKSARLMIFAINSGILQVARYQLPNPIAHFFKKAALQVDTYQILSLLLPEYKILREFAKTGGGDYDAGDGATGMLTNPFARRTEKSVAFYSGIIDTHAGTAGTITFDIPEYFNGAIKIFAVASNDNAAGSASTESKVQSPLIITTGAPLFAAPGDRFDVNTVVANMIADAPTATVKVTANATDNLEITNTPASEMTIARDAEQSWGFGVRAKDEPGNAEITINATAMNDNKKLAGRHNTSTLSVRPATTFETAITTGTINQTQQKIKYAPIDMYAQQSNRILYVSANASVFMRPLVQYLEKYEYPCTEQLTSRAVPYVVAANDPVLGTTLKKSDKAITDTINQLKNRQNDDGSFNLWAGDTRDMYTARDTAATANLTAYVVNFLTMARDAGFTVPQNMLSRGVDWLRTYAGETINNADDAAATAFAIYVISRNGFVTTSYIDLLREYADKNIRNWDKQLMGAYIAASYKMLKQDDKADALIRKYAVSESKQFVYKSMFDNNVANDAMYEYLVRQYFDGTPRVSDATREYINRGEYSAYTSAAVIMALGGAKKQTMTPNQISVTIDDTPVAATTDGAIISAALPADASRITVKCPECDKNGLYYAIVQQGFPRQSHDGSHGIEIIREYYDDAGNQISRANVGDRVTVKIFARTRGGVDNALNVVITDLLPGGFIVDGDPSTESQNVEFTEIREDRVLIFCTLKRDTTEITYTAQIGAAGTFAVPAIRAASMYNPQINATGATGTFTVINESEK